jgi:hypothetical protein
LPFYFDVYGLERRQEMSWVEKMARRG